MKDESKTKARLIEELQAMRKQLEYQQHADAGKARRLEQIITNFSARLISLEIGQIDDAIWETLGEIGTLERVDRCYVFQLSQDGKWMVNTHEWCARGIQPQIYNLQALPAEDFSWLLTPLQRFEDVHIPRVADLPPEETLLKEHLLAQGIQSLVVVPLVEGQVLMGFAGFDSVRTERRWHEDEVQLLRVTADIIMNALARKHNEEARRESEERYSSLFERILDGIYSSTHDGRFIDVNPAMAKMFGYGSREEMLKVDIRNELYFDSADRDSHILDRGEKGIEIYRMRRKDGSEIWVEDHGYYVYDDRGNVVLHEGLLRDITERRLMESALHASESQSQAIVAALPDLLFRINTDLRFIDCRANNPADLLFPPEQVIGRRLDEVLPLYLAELTAGKMQRVLESGEMQVYEYTLLINGVEQYYETRMTPSGSRAVLALVRDITRQKRAEAALKQVSEDLVTAYDATLQGWSHALELREHETAGHSRRAVRMTIRLARALGFPQDRLVHVQRGALLHDIGKMGIPDNILLKPAGLSEEEWVVMRQHPVFAYQLLSEIPYLEPALEIPYCHHEHWDGSGYPRGLKGEEIPLSARIFAVVDTWDALLHDRPYRPAMESPAVIEHVRNLSGTHFDPGVVEAFLGILQKGMSEDAADDGLPPDAAA